MTIWESNGNMTVCIKSMIEALPSDAQKKDVLEFQVPTRYLQPLLQALFDDDELMFKWSNQACFNDQNNELYERPDGRTESDDCTIGYLEVRPINKAKDHKKINTDLYRLGVFAKAATRKSVYIYGPKALSKTLYNGDVPKLQDLINTFHPTTLGEQLDVMSAKLAMAIDLKDILQVNALKLSLSRIIDTVNTGVTLVFRKYLDNQF